MDQSEEAVSSSSKTSLVQQKEKELNEIVATTAQAQKVLQANSLNVDAVQLIQDLLMTNIKLSNENKELRQELETMQTTLAVTTKKYGQERQKLKTLFAALGIREPFWKDDLQDLVTITKQVNLND